MNELKRCAIYTRKSVEEGLDAEFNTLEAQRKYCEAYVADQPGWLALPERYDDGGYSGGNMNRPAMKRLLEDVDAGKVDVIVVYKVDRLSRSIVDFANLSAHLEKKGVTFVLVTQNIDTSTSMGRMQLNLLMTFAQFEREMSSDRIRDKVAAMRQRGMWTGGPRPYGYTPKERRLMVAPEEAPIVCRIFKDYVRLASPLMIARNLNAEGIPYRNGKPWTAKTIQRILHNPLYIGKVTHKGETFQGEHEALISETLWQQANDTRGVRVPVPSSRKPNVVPLLRGKLFCASCRRPMHHSLHQRGKRTYRYYVCHSTCAGDLESDRCKVSRLPADLLEREICALLQAELKQPELVAEVARESKNPNLKAVQRAVVNPVLMKELPLGERHRLMDLLVRRIEVSTESVTLVLDGEALTGEEGAEEVVKTLPLHLVQASSQITLTFKSEEIVIAPETIPILVAIQTARKWKRWLIDGTIRSVYELSQRLNYDKRYIQRRFKLAFISPRILLALLNQNVSLKVSLRKLEDIATLPWPEQEQAVGLL